MTNKTQITSEDTALNISAFDKTEVLLNSTLKALEDFNKIKAEVEIIKSDLNLRLTTHEAQINEMKDILDASLAAQAKLNDTIIKAQKYGFSLIQKILRKEEEEIEKGNLETAKAIADSKGLVLLPKHTEDGHKFQIMVLKKKYESDLIIVTNAAVKSIKEELTEIIRNKETIIANLNCHLASANKRVVTLNTEVTYLKEQLDSDKRTFGEKKKTLSV